MSLLVELREDYEALGKLLMKAEGSGAAAIVRERRILRELLERLEKPDGNKSKIDELEERRRKRAAKPAKKAVKKSAKKAAKKAAKKSAKKRAVPAAPPARRRQSRRSG